MWCKMWRVFVVGACAVLTGGCVTHTPVSEMILFHDPATRPAFEGGREVGFIGTMTPTREVAHHLAQREYGESAYDLEDILLNPNQYSAGLYAAAFDDRGRYAVAATLGFPVFGLDATVKVGRRDFVTASASVPGQVQAYWHHRTFNSPHIGAAVGVGYRQDLYSFDIPGPFLPDIQTVTLGSFGVRGFVFYHNNDGPNDGVKLGTYVGYAPGMDRLVWNMTLTLGGL